MSVPDDPILGLDLGTSTCEACVWDGSALRHIESDWYYTDRNQMEPDHPGQVMPSVFSHHDGKPIVGWRAVEDLLNPPYAQQVVQAVKRRMDEDHTYYLGDRAYSPSDITAEYVKVLRNAAAIQLKIKPDRLRRAVVAVPASFGPRAQYATIQACVKGGLTPDGIKLIDEPIAAAYSLSVGLREQKELRRLLVIDLGGGTFDVTLWEAGRPAGRSGFRELSRDGDSRLGGLSWDETIAQWVVREAKPPFSDDDIVRLIHADSDHGHVELFGACQQAKETLSMQMEKLRVHKSSDPLDPKEFAPLLVSFMPSDEDGERRRVVSMPVADFLAHSKRHLKRCLRVCDRLFRDVATRCGIPDFEWAQIHDVYLAGGGSRLPVVQRLFAERCGSKLRVPSNPQQAVVQGAAMVAEWWRRGQTPPDLCGKPRYPLALGLMVKPPGATNGARIFEPIIPRNQDLPFALEDSWNVNISPTARKLVIRFAEQEERDGEEPTIRELAAVPVENLPPRPNGDAREQALLKMECGLDYVPMCQVVFRGETKQVNIKDLIDSQSAGPG